MDRTKTDTELREAKREEYGICPLCGASGEQYRKLIDSLSQSITEAVIRAISEGARVDSTDRPADPVRRGQSAFVSNAQREPDRIVTGKRENNSRVQWRDTHH